MTQQVCIKAHATNTAALLAVAATGSTSLLQPDTQTGEFAIWDGAPSIVVSEAERFDFSMALALIRNGKRVARSGWNGKGMFLLMVRADQYAVEVECGQPRQLPWIAMKTADNGFVPWLASQTDLLATDWVEA